jgi:outer membrane protein OmpA-like peptidoglycan-associated protein
MGKLMNYRTMLGVAALATVAMTSGCASKGYVRQSVAPVDKRVTDVEQKSADNSTKIEGLEEQLDRDVNRLDERTASNERAAADAARQAKVAHSRADEAHGLAETGISRVTGLEQAVDDVVDSLEDYQMVAHEVVLFDLNSSELKTEAKEALDGASGKITKATRYVVEIRGFTDTSGSPEYNLALSRKRADAVVRYLTLQKEVPLHRIHVVGLGEEAPNSDNKTREGRQQNRRVEVKLFVADVTAAGSGSQRAGLD